MGVATFLEYSSILPSVANRLILPLISMMMIMMVMMVMMVMMIMMVMMVNDYGDDGDSENEDNGWKTFFDNNKDTPQWR